jgi:hypothetical protein
MKMLKFTFKNEAKWILIMSLAPLAIGMLLALVVMLLRR